MRLVAAALVMSSACVSFDEPHGDGVVGSRADMQTGAGDYAGYRVVTSCALVSPDVGITGTGSIALTATADIEAAAAELHTRVEDFASIWGWGGYGLACESGIGTWIDTNNWRDVDPLIERIGDWLRERDYALQVGIAVGGQPVPVASE